MKPSPSWRMAPVIALLLVAPVAMMAQSYSGQDTANASSISRPRPYFYGGLDLDGNGSAVLNYAIGAGIQENTNRFIFDASAAYANTRKTNDNTINNHSGRTRHLAAAPRYRLPNGWFLGGGASWDELSTTNYVKQAFRPFIGGGKDWQITRITADYLWTASEHVNRQGCLVPHGQCTNGVRGLNFMWFMPSPRSRSHVLFRMNLSSFWFHMTVTTTDPALTRKQESELSVGSDLEYTVLFRY
jgi:hypothetical protein